MSFDPRRYPSNWREFSLHIRRDRAKGRCECLGECGLHKTTGGPRRCEERNGESARWARGKVVLTVAHLDYQGGPCRCERKCAIPEHVRAMCNRCHLRCDMPHHRAKASATRARKATGATLPLIAEHPS